MSPIYKCTLRVVLFILTMLTTVIYMSRSLLGGCTFVLKHKIIFLVKPGKVVKGLANYGDILSSVSSILSTSLQFSSKATRQCSDSIQVHGEQFCNFACISDRLSKWHFHTCRVYLRLAIPSSSFWNLSKSPGLKLFSDRPTSACASTPRFFLQITFSRI